MEDAVVVSTLKARTIKINLSWGNRAESEEVFVDKGQIQQVLLNLMLNAVEVMPNGGDLFIDTQLKDGRVHIFM